MEKNHTKTYFKPSTVTEAVQIATEHENSFAYVAGGTDLMVNRFQGNNAAGCLIDISGIGSLKEVYREGDYLHIGALTVLDDLQFHPEITSNFPVLPEAARAVASPVLRKSATVGGNILCENRCMYYNQSEWWREAVGYCLKCNGNICIASGGTKACFSKFVSDMAIALIALEAKITVLNGTGERTIPLHSIYTGDGVHPRSLQVQSLITSILVPVVKQHVVFKKLRKRESVDFSSLTTAVSLKEKGGVKIVLGGVDPKPVVIEGSGTDDEEDMIQKAVKKARIVENDSYSRVYRKKMISVYLKRSFEELRQK